MILTPGQIIDDYRLLGLEIGAPPEETKSAFRRLVKRWHPDVSADPVEIATGKTRELCEAFERLRSLSAGEIASVRNQLRAPRETPPGTVPRPQRRPGGKGVRRTRRRSGQRGGLRQDQQTNQRTRPGRDVLGDLVMHPRQAQKGARWRLRITTCHACGGWGADVESAFEVCPRCTGWGRHRWRGGWDLDARCLVCEGFGCLFDSCCSHCDGGGDRSFYEVTCLVPGGDVLGTVHRYVAGQGHRGLSGGSRGDLYLRIHINE